MESNEGLSNTSGSPVARRRKALDQFAASMSASQESRPSPQFLPPKVKLGRLSINLQDCSDSKKSDLPMISSF